MQLLPRDTQTQVKHTILEKYLNSWSNIILSGLEAKANQSGSYYKVKLVYVDCFAYVGKYSGNQEDIYLEQIDGPVPGSPVIGIRALDEVKQLLTTRYPHIDLAVNAILVEKDNRNFSFLVQNLKGYGYDSRIKRTSDFSTLTDGDIAVVCDDVLLLADSLTSFTNQRFTWAFYLIDAYGPSGMPYKFVKEIICPPKHDVLINFMYLDLQRKSGSYQKDGKLVLRHEKHAKYWSEVFGSEEWIDVLEEVEEIRQILNQPYPAIDQIRIDQNQEILIRDIRESEIPIERHLSELTEMRLIKLYRSVLQELNSGIAVKTIRLQFPDKDRTMFYLFLTTHDGTGALRMNRILDDAALLEYNLRYMRYHAKRQQPPGTQLFLIPPDKPEPPEVEPPPRPSKTECAEVLFEVLNGRVVTLREVYVVMANHIFYDSEIKAAISLLKREGRAQYSQKNLTNQTEITFGYSHQT